MPYLDHKQPQHLNSPYHLVQRSYSHNSGKQGNLLYVCLCYICFVFIFSILFTLERVSRLLKPSKHIAIAYDLIDLLFLLSKLFWGRANEQIEIAKVDSTPMASRLHHDCRGWWYAEVRWDCYRPRSRANSLILPRILETLTRIFEQMISVIGVNMT